MTRTFEINGREVEFTEVTAVWHKEPEAGRREAILIHDTTDEFHDGDGIVFEAHMPEDEEDAENLLSETIETYYETLDTIETVEAEERKKEIDMTFYVNYGTGVKEKVEGTLGEAVKAAEEGLAYTQLPVSIEDENGEVIAQLPWYGVAPSEDDIVTCKFGNYGFYGEWDIDDRWIKLFDAENVGKATDPNSSTPKEAAAISQDGNEIEFRHNRRGR